MNGSHDAGNTYSSTADWHAHDVWRNKKCDLWLWPQKLVLHPTPSITKEIDERTSLAFWFAAKKYRFIFFRLHRMLNSVRCWRLRGRECERRTRETRSRENSRVFSILLYARNVMENLNLWFSHCLFTFLFVCACVLYAYAYAVEV